MIRIVVGYCPSVFFPFKINLVHLFILLVHHLGFEEEEREERKIEVAKKKKLTVKSCFVIELVTFAEIGTELPSIGSGTEEEGEVEVEGETTEGDGAE